VVGAVLAGAAALGWWIARGNDPPDVHSAAVAPPAVAATPLEEDTSPEPPAPALPARRPARPATEATSAACDFAASKRGSAASEPSPDTTPDHRHALQQLDAALAKRPGERA